MFDKHPNQRSLLMLAAAARDRAGEPLFYREHSRALHLSEAILTDSPFAQRTLAIVAERKLAAGHGVGHAQRVALEAGAIVLIERQEREGDWREEVTLAHLSGLLHDICRNEADHADKGAKEAQEILSNFPLTPKARQRVSLAIAAHEAFREPTERNLASDTLLADALYDADKFRWGPDNFTSTLWEMLTAGGHPLEKLFEHWERGIEGIKRIRSTFRSATGKFYGPDFIDRGLAIGEVIYDFWITGQETRSGEGK